MKKIIFSIVALICLLIGFVQFRNIKELASGMFSSRTEVTPAIAMQDILPTNIAIEDSVKVDSTLNIQAEKLSTTESDAEKLDTTRNAAAEALTEEKNSIGHSQSETKGTSPEAAVSNSKIEIEEFANIPTANSKSSSSNVDELPLKNNQKIAKSKDKNLQILTTFAEKKTVTPQPSVVKKENIKVEIATNNSQKAAKIIPLTSLKETSTKATKAGNNDKLGSNVTMYASLLTPKSNDNTEIIKEYINDELLPKEPETVPIAPKSESQLTQGIDEKFTPVDTMNAIKTAKIMEVSTPAEHPSKKNQTVESTSYTSVVESTLLPNISYSNTQNFTVGMQITPLIPLNSGSVIPATIYGHVSTIAGGGPNGDSGLKNGISLSARFYYPYSAVVDTKGNIYVADQGNSLIRKITPSGIVSTLAGSGSAGFADGVGTAASFSNPKGLAVDSAGNVYVADAVNNRIRKITSEGVVTTLAGNSASGFIDGLGNQASFYNPSAIALDAKGNLYVADEKNHAVRKISPSGEVNTLAGNGSSGSVNGNGAEASFNYPSGIALDGFGNVYVADFSNHKIRKITPDGLVSTIAGTGSIGRINGAGTMASFHNPTGISVDKAGNIYVADAGNHQIRKITTQGLVSTLPCTESEGSISNLTTNTGFYNPSGVIADGKGSIYVTDQNNNRIRKIGVTGYTISPSLPSGLLFDSSSGIVSGTPTIASELTEYTITAYNSTGSSTTSITLATVSQAVSTNVPYATQ